MTSYHDTPTYDRVESQARAHWQAERPDSDYPGDQEPNEILARAEAEWAVRRAALRRQS